jgi:hypothetical protein
MRTRLWRAVGTEEEIVWPETVVCGCRRADPDVRQAERVRITAWRIAGRRHCRPPGRTCLAVSAGVPPAARWAAAMLAGAEAGGPRGGPVSRRKMHQIRGGHANLSAPVQ